MIKKCIVTGATGYIGSKLSQKLLDSGWKVDVILRESGTRLPPSLDGKVFQHIYDGTTQSLLNVVELTKPDVVFHLASLFIAEHRSSQVSDLINSNLLFATQIIEACAVNGVKYFINTGTSWQHYRSNEFDPVCLYAATKQAFECLLDFYADAYKIKVVTLKLFDTYGPDDPRPKLINLILKSINSGEQLNMSPGQQLIDLVHVNDVTRAYILAAHHLMSDFSTCMHERYAVTSGSMISLQKLVELIENVTGRSINAKFGVRPYRNREVMLPWSDHHKVPGWEAEINLYDGIHSIKI